jgi:hypothetical protein
MAVFGAVAVAAFLALAALFLLRANGLQAEVDTLAASDQKNRAAAEVNHDAAQTLADQVKQLGGTPKVEPPPGPTGSPGPTGPAGRGITGTSISAGHLFVTYSDGATEDKGQVQGAAGVTGPAGRGITGANATSGHLVLSYSDGSTADAGQVVGKDGAVGATGAAGRGVQSVTNNNGHLIVTYTDSITEDAGPLPAGPPGPTGPQGLPGTAGQPPAGWTWTDTLGRTYQCTRDPKSPDSSPTYSCPAVTPSTSTAPPLLKPTR